MNEYEREIEKRAVPFQSENDLEPLVEQFKDKKVVMIGEASHGTHEFYHWRAALTRLLIEKHGFHFVAVEGDWPSCEEVNQYALDHRGNTIDSLLSSAFHRWPTWMWANRDVAQFAEWMRARNSSLGFHGLDVYSLFESLHEAIHQIRKVDLFLARRLEENYSCFDPYLGDEKSYVRSLLKFPEGCEQEVLDSLQAILKKRVDHPLAGEILLNAAQNARIVQNAERYYRAMIHADDESWNIRDRHMMETLNVLFQYYGPNSKGIVWEHNTHIGDYRATDMLAMGHINIGGLAREQFGEESVGLVGFGTYQGTVVASHSWDGPTQVLPVPPARSESVEEACHHMSENLRTPQFFFALEEARGGALSEMKGHRAIGVVYDPRRERWGNYVPTQLAHRYDAFIFIDETSALVPVSRSFDRTKIPDLWPAGR